MLKLIQVEFLKLRRRKFAWLLLLSVNYLKKTPILFEFSIEVFWLLNLVTLDEGSVYVYRCTEYLSVPNHNAERVSCNT